jgi:uncharacterized Zn finger protein
MASVVDLVQEPFLRERAAPGAYQRGAELAAAGAVELNDFGPLLVRANIGLNEVVLRSGAGELDWSCDCPVGKGPELCEHVIAVAIVTWQRSPKRRGR